MIKHVCTVSTNAERGTHGDCFRACIASILDIPDIEDVPHFLNPDDVDTAIENMREWLLSRGYAPLYISVDHDEPIEAVHDIMRGYNRSTLYILIGNTELETHCAIYRNGELIHDPAWFYSPIVRPPETGDWTILVITYAGLQ